ncbi:MAG TPA: DNA translocase FtsK 4TM domain-containing protein, partial [Pseudobdellovibrionaceae bacterium]|nr:DNA translocase FtsK 4TM domain-containing protein [Pseudobdellovibrionaceae bacterium]
MSPIFKKFQQDIVAISFLTLGLFLALALMSFSPRDPSLNSLGTALKASNYCGIAGSFLADLLYQFMGLSAWVLVAGAFRRSWKSFQGESFHLKDSRFIWGTLLIVSLSTLLGLYFSKTKLFEEQIFVGGILGLGVSQSLVRVFNPIGVQVLLWAGLAVLAVFYSERSIQDWMKLLRKPFGKFNLAAWMKAQLSELRKKTKAKPKAKQKPEPAAVAASPQFSLSSAFVDEETEGEEGDESEAASGDGDEAIPPPKVALTADEALALLQMGLKPRA